MNLFRLGGKPHDARVSDVANGCLLLGARQLPYLSKRLRLVYQCVIP